MVWYILAVYGVACLTASVTYIVLGYLDSSKLLRLDFGNRAIIALVASLAAVVLAQNYLSG